MEFDYDALDREIFEALIEVFDHDCDAIYLWLETPLTALEELRPQDAWVQGRRRQLLEVVRAMRRVRGGGTEPPGSWTGP